MAVKAQVHAGGRGLAGGIKLVDSPTEAEEAASSLLNTRLVTHQTDARGLMVNKVLVEEVVAVERELFLCVVVDRAARGPIVIVSDAGGMNIEEIASQSPEKIVREPIHPLIRLAPWQGLKLAKAMGLSPEMVPSAVRIMQSLFELFWKNDCSLAEINPLAVTSDQGLMALDAKVNIEDYALGRHLELAALRDVEQEDELEARATSIGASYITLDGDVGCLVNGAGLAMATIDSIRNAGWSPANFLDMGGRADQNRIAMATDIILSDPRVRRILINVFGGILQCDVVSRGIMQAYERQGSTIPMVVRMQGTNAAQGRQLLMESGLPVTLVESLADAVKAVAGN
jgi:succinyl-CoA synthetase beta subunit